MITGCEASIIRASGFKLIWLLGGRVVWLAGRGSSGVAIAGLGVWLTDGLRGLKEKLGAFTLKIQTVERI